MERVGTLVVGGGQAGLAMSEQLGRRGLPHLVVERHRIAERWRSERWDGLHANGPAWHDRLPLVPIAGVAPDGFATRDQMVAYFEEYAARIAAPLRTGVAVTALRHADDGAGFVAETDAGPIAAARVVAATGPFQRPVIPALVPKDGGTLQLHSSAYRNLAALPAGAVLVVGAGSSGAQIADELVRAGRRVFLSVGRHQRLPRRYRGQDYCWWLGVLGLWDAPVADPPAPHVTIAVSGARGGQTVDFRDLAARGVTLLGRAEGYADGALRFAPDVAATLAAGDAAHHAMLDAADAYVAREGLAMPEEPSARVVAADPDCVRAPLGSLDLRGAGVGAIVWATGYTANFGWLRVGERDARGIPPHRRGVTDVPGLYLLGLSWLSRRGSAFVFGVADDAAYLADHIAGAAA